MCVIFAQGYELKKKCPKKVKQKIKIIPLGGKPNLPKLYKPKKVSNTKINFAAWEVKKTYDDVIKAIGRNRKRILELFK